MSALKLFVDESYQSDHYYIGGVLVDDQQYSILNNRLNELADWAEKRYRLDRSPEFHGHAIMAGQDDWRVLSGDFGAKFSIYQKVMHAIRNSDAEVILEGVDVGRLNARYKYPDSPHEVCLRHLLERYNERYSARNQMFNVIADIIPDQDSQNQAIQSFKEVKTPGYRSQNLYSLDGDIKFVDSRVERGVQAADMCVYILRRNREEQYQSKKIKRATQRLVKSLGDSLVYERKWRP